ncbi:MAG TPA: HDOD domain-containing protein, partial [Spirochaetota bacterium]|nr:HDOD domain-containing protein [Spirochaetota bacterium]
MENITISDNEIKYYIDKGKPIVFKDSKISRELEDGLVDVLAKILSHLGKEKISDSLGYCLRELINNSKKANLKRVFFLDQNLDINDKTHYDKGMSLFKEKAFSNLDYYLDLMEEKEYYVQTYYRMLKNCLNIIISNNAQILPQELERINQKISKAKIFNSVEEAMRLVFDDTEGAGFGIVIIILILKKIGISDKNFAIATEKGFTHTRIAIPLDLVTEEDENFIGDSLIDEINSIPQFPDHILTLSKMLSHKDVNIKEVTDIIKKDPALTMDILKMANSAHYRRLNKIERVDLAISIIGIRGLKSLIDTIGAKKSLEQKYANEEMQALWSHSSNVAAVSSILCENFRLLDFGEYAYIGGLLHDIGKIVIKGLRSDTVDKLLEICKDKKIPAIVIEKLLEGTNHPVIGAKMAEKWQLTDTIVKIIRYHHNPLGAPEEVRKLLELIYFAHIIVDEIFKTEAVFEFKDEILEIYNL